MGEAYARNTSRKTVNDNFIAQQQRVRRAKRKRIWRLDEFNRSQKETADMSEEDRDAKEIRKELRSRHEEKLRI